MIRADYIFIAALVMLIIAHTTTNFLIKYYEDATEAVGIAKSAALEYEANPIARWLFGIVDMKYMFSYALAPGALTGLYWFIRKKYRKDNMAIESYAIAMFTITFLTALNDVSILIGVLV